MALCDTRSFLEKLKEAGELLVVDQEVDADAEAAAIVAKLNEDGGQAVWFRNVKGTTSGASLAGGLYAGPGLLYYRTRKPWTRIALALNIDPDVTYEDFLFTINDRSQRGQIKPLRLGAGRCKDITSSGDDVDLTRYPFPQVHPTDGGRYGVGTTFVQDPDTRAIHAGAYRWMVLGKDRIVCNLPPNRPISAIFKKYQERGEAMPFAIAFGGSPALQVAAHMGLPATADILGIAGGLCQDPIELVGAENDGLLVPADADLVLEGTFSLTETASEGPYATFIDIGTVSQQPVGTVRVITQQEHPIITFGVDSARGGDLMNLTSLLHAAELMTIAKTATLPVRWIALPTETRLGLCVISSKVPYNGFAFQMTGLIFGSSAWFDKLLIVDYDVNPEQLNLAVNDMLNKANPARAWYRSDADAPATKVAKYPTENGMTAQVYILATWDAQAKREEIGQKIAFESCYPPEIQERVLSRWKKDYGFTHAEPIVYRIVSG